MSFDDQYEDKGLVSKYMMQSDQGADSDPARQFMREQLDTLPRDVHVLDVGCGSGLDIASYKNMGFSYLYGVEPSEAFLSEARNAVGDSAELVQGSFERLPFSEGMFDVVTARYALHYVRNIDDALREVSRVLKPGGIFVAVVSNPKADALEEVDSEGNITITLFEGIVSLTYPLHTTGEYFSDTFDELFIRERVHEYIGGEQDRRSDTVPNALCFVARKR